MKAGRSHIVLDGLLVGPRPTGVGRSILELLNALAAEDRGWEFTVLATHAEPFAYLRGEQHWEIVVCPGARGGSFKKAVFTQIRMPGLCRRLGADLVHSLQFVVPMRAPCRKVVTVHDLAWKYHAGILQTSRRLYYDLMVPRSLAAADAIVTNSESTAADVRKFLPAVADRVHTTPFGTPSWVWPLEAADRNSAAGPEEPYFLFVGTLEPRKNLERLLAAYEMFVAASLEQGRGEREIPRLWLAGAKGWNDGPLRRAIRKLLATGRLRLLDYCPPDKLWGLYRDAAGLVFPSLHEGFGFPILEAMAAGCPVLTSGRGAMREVAGPEAVFVQPEDIGDISRGLGDLAWDEGGNRRRREAGLSRVRQWNWERTAATTCDVYRRVLGSGD